MKRNLQAFFYTLLSVLIFALAIPNEILYFGSPLLGLIALVPLYYAMTKTSSFLMAGIFVGFHNCLLHILSSFWLANFKDFAIFTLGASAAAYLAGGFVLGQLLYAPFYFSKKKTSLLKEKAGLSPYSSPCRILLFAAIWTSAEWFKSTGFLAYPWGTLIMTSWKWKLVTQIVAITGTWGVSFLFALFSAVIGEGFLQLSIASLPFAFFKQGKQRSYALTATFCITLFAVTVVYGAYEYTKEREPIKYLETVMVQQNTNSWDEGNNMASILLSQELANQVIEESSIKPNLIVWSESVLNYAMPGSWDYYTRYPRQKPLVTGIRETNTPHLIGGPYLVNKERQKYSNSALLFDSNGELIEHYGKIQLVPFAEVIPYEDNPIVQKFMQSVVGFSSGWTPGTLLTLFTVLNNQNEPVTFSAPICFEDAFPYVCRQLFLEGSELFVNITNDSWSLTHSAEYQHFVISSFRAQEFRTTLIRSTNSGYSVVVDPVGNIIADMPLFESTAMAVSVPIYQREMTVYALYGDWLPYLLIICIVLYYLGIIYLTFKKKN